MYYSRDEVVSGVVLASGNRQQQAENLTSQFDDTLRHHAAMFSAEMIDDGKPARVVAPEWLVGKSLLIARCMACLMSPSARAK